MTIPPENRSGSSTILPPEIIKRLDASPHLARMTFLLEIAKSMDRRDCDNCSGMGKILVFVADNGPFRNVPPPQRDKVIHSMDDEVYGFVWYQGETHALNCPVCQGTGKASQQLQPEIAKPSFRDHTV